MASIGAAWTLLSMLERIEKHESCQSSLVMGEMDEGFYPRGYKVDGSTIR